MKIIKEDEVMYLVLSNKEWKIVNNSIREVMKAIDDWEFPIRTGVAPEKARIFTKRIESFSEAPEVRLGISREEGLLVNNTLNEVCHGVVVQDFENRIGASKNEVAILLDEVNSAIWPDE